MHRQQLFRGTADYSYEQRLTGNQASPHHTMPHHTSNPIGEKCSRYHVMWLQVLAAFHRQVSFTTTPYSTVPHLDLYLKTIIPYHTTPNLESYLCRRQVRVQHPDREAQGRDRRPASAEAEREARPLEPPRDALRGHHDETRWGETTRQAREPL